MFNSIAGRAVCWSCAIVMATGGLAWAEAPSSARAERPALAREALAARVKELFRVRCFECHGGTRTNGGIKILDSASLVEMAVVAGNPEESLLYQLVTADEDSAMPP